MRKGYPEGQLGHPRPRLPRDGEDLEERGVLLPVELVNSLVLAAWVGVSLLGTVLGLGFAKYSQAWAQEELHPGAAVGSVMVVVSAALGILATIRYWIWGAASLGLSRAVGVLSILLIIALAWAALALIAFAGWEFLPQRAE